MSMNKIIKATCPDCKKEFPFEMWQSINVQLNPELREKVFDHSIFNFECPHCVMKAHTAYPFLYNDMKNGFMIQFCPDEEDVEEYANSLQKIIESDKATGALNNTYIRIVTEYFLLEEKIKIFESGYDDRLIELLKSRQIKDLNINKPENNLAFALFDLRANKDLRKKDPIPTLVFINEDGKEVFDCPISIIPGAVGQVKDDYNYLDDKSFVVDMNWANKYVYHEKLTSNLFNVNFDENAISDEGAGIAAKLITLLRDKDLQNAYFEAFDEKENQAIKQARKPSAEKIADAIQAFYRYTNFKTALEEMRRKTDFPWREQLGFLFDQINMNEFYTVYFNTANELFPTLGGYFLKALIHGAEFDSEYPFDFSIESRDRTKRSLGVYWQNQFNDEKENDIHVLKDYYNEHKKDTWALSAKNMVVRYIYQYELPEDDPLHFDPLVTDKMWEEHQILESQIYDKMREAQTTTKESKEEWLGQSLAHVLDIWKVSFTKYDIGRCFELIAGYYFSLAFYDNELYRKAYINQVISSAYRPNNFGMMYIKKQYKGDISTNEFKTYEIETGMPTHASEELHEMIFERYKDCEQKDDKFGQVYYLNLLYNYNDEKSKESLAIDTKLNQLLREIEL